MKQSSVNRRRKPGEIFSRRYAIVNFCRECHGWDRGDDRTLNESIRKCPSPECHLYPWRTGDLKRD